MLPQLQLGIHTPFSISSDPREARLLSEIYDEELEDVCRKAYQKDYRVFGYGPLFPPLQERQYLQFKDTFQMSLPQYNYR
jgi:hypothetical protein